MFINIFGKSDTARGVKISNLGNNADDLLVKITNVKRTTPNTLTTSIRFNEEMLKNFIPKIEVHIEAYNKEEYLNGDFNKGKLVNIPNVFETYSEFTGDINEVISLREIAEYLKIKVDLTENVDYKFVAEANWDDEGKNLPVRVSIPSKVVIDNANYAGLILKVKSLISMGYAVLHPGDFTNVMYFRLLLPEDYDVIKDDPNVLIEYK